MEDFSITEEGELTPEKAFEQAKAGFTFQGETLKPYTASRKVAAQSLGLLYPYIGEGGAEALEKTGVYPGALMDTIIVIWLCTLDNPMDLTRDQIRAGAWTPSKAMSKQEEAKEVMFKWAEEKGILDTQCEKFMQAYEIFIAIAAGAEASDFELKVEGARAEDNNDPKV